MSKDGPYLVELEVLDFGEYDSATGEKRILKLRFTVSKADRMSLIHALHEQILMAPDFNEIKDKDNE